ncbi:hypothetical protein J4E83_001455 [Alternaria metachromatica]|uniref:uncharacterized protein n=1 Tax=Alternaria metachromatica TaxID=283354 RepID=UPI0020C58DCB|nr:uncharacterized protein J4E83_001455 [Alternaria metachromatica]KAI4636500.1 hypothetical protein J4E83_001455 [Alternaria metachromatica]
MAPTGITLEDVQAWAIRDFPDQFKHLPDAGAFRTQFNIIRGYNHDRGFKSFVIGSTYTKTRKQIDLMAWLAGPHIVIGCIGKNRKGEPQIRPMTLTKENASSWTLEFPFNLIPPTQSQTEVACCDAMLRYYFLAKGWSEGVIDDSNLFNSPSPSPPPIEGPVTRQVLRSPLELQSRFGYPQPDNPGGDQMAALDESNNAGERDSPGLRNKLFDLNIQLMIAEGRARDAETVAQKAQEESQLWKKRYEEAESYRTKYEKIRSHFGLQEQDERRA